MSNGDTILAKPLKNGDIAFCLLNEGDSPKKMILSWQYCGWEMTDRVRLRDVVNHTDMGEYVHGMYAFVEPHSARVFRATRL